MLVCALAGKRLKTQVVRTFATGKMTSLGAKLAKEPDPEQKEEKMPNDLNAPWKRKLRLASWVMVGSVALIMTFESDAGEGQVETVFTQLRRWYVAKKQQFVANYFTS